jgi:phosphoribosyl 1,2-cyclic phosphodiesterase
MELIILGSSSKGNCYLLQTTEEILIIEAGIKFSEIKKVLNFDFDLVKGVIISHEHRDHSKAFKDLLENGIDIFASAGTIKALDIDQIYSPTVIRHGDVFKVGSFTILPFKTYHDAAEPLGFLINHPKSGDILFFTDTVQMPYKFEGCKHLLVECNYDAGRLLEKTAAGKLPYSVYSRIAESHFSFEKLKHWLRLQDLDSVENIVLLHSSAENSNGDKYVTELQKLYGKPVFEAKKGMIINLTI